MATDVYPTRPGGSGSTATKPKVVDPVKAAADRARAAENRARADARAAENRANARADADKRKAGQKYLTQAENLAIQAAAIKKALSTYFASNRDQNLTDISKNLGEQIDLLKSSTNKRARSFLDSAADTEKAAGDNAEAGLSNLVRERQDAMMGILQNGAGETDAMRAMLMSARNWQANASEGSRAYFDSMRSVNSGITDLNADAQTAFGNAYRSAEGERDAVWDDFYRKRSESYTQLGNIYGTQANYYAEAKALGVSPKKNAVKNATAGMKDAYTQASAEAGKSYKQKELPDWVQDYAGQAPVQTRLSNTDLAAAVTIGPAEKAQGASLRRWEG
jgi:vacuolar-type H+-ATPase subunit E/Vma4